MEDGIEKMVGVKGKILEGEEKIEIKIGSILKGDRMEDEVLNEIKRMGMKKVEDEEEMYMRKLMLIGDGINDLM